MEEDKQIQDNDNTTQQAEQVNQQQQQSQDIVSENKPFNYDDYIEDDGFPITVAVVDPIVKEGVSKYILYTIKGEDKNGTFEIIRRFNDFYCLRHQLAMRWPGIFIPPIPPKKATGNFEAEFIEERRHFFDSFLNEVSKSKYLWYSDEFSIFLRTQNPDIEKALSGLQKLYYEDVINKFQEVFKTLQGKVFELGIGREFSANEQFTKINYMLKQEIYEIDSFLESIEKSLYYYEQEKKIEEQKIREHEKELAKAQEGKTSKLKSLFSSKTGDQIVLEETQKVDLHTVVHDKISQIIDLIKVILGYIEIDKYKSKKVKQYYHTLKEIAQYEYEFSKLKAQLWECVLENDNITSITAQNA